MKYAPLQRPTIRTSGTNLKKAKVHNHSVVLDLIRSRGPISRTELHKITSLSRQTIQNIVQELETAHLVSLTTSKISGRGHPGKDISINEDYAYNLGFQIDASAIRAVVCNLVGSVVWSATYDPLDHSGDEATRILVGALEDFKQAHPDKVERLLGVGLAAPGPFVSDGESDLITDFDGPGTTTTLHNLRQAFGLPVVLENDASAAALGEYLYGEGRRFQHFAFVHFGIGLGAGLVVNGSIFRGAGLNAGEIGHIVVEDGGRPCSCGNVGCLERYLSLGALCETLNISPSAPDLHQQIDAALDAPSPALTAWMEEAAHKFRQVISILELTMDPETIIVGGTAPARFIDAILAASPPLHLKLVARPSDHARVMRGATQVNTVALGAAASSREAHFAPSVGQLLL